MSSTLGSKDPLARNVGFVLNKHERKNGQSDMFKCLKLGFRTEWPVNIIIPQEIVDLYGDMFQFLLQLRKAVWGLEQVFIDMIKNLSKSKSSFKNISQKLNLKL